MPPISRRHFLQTASATVAAGSLARIAHADPLGLPIGCQTWPVRQMIAKDFPGTLKQLAAAGFQAIELCSPAGYSDSGFGGLQKFSGAELRKVIQDAGLTSVSSHFSMDELRKDQPARIAWAKEVGLTQMLVASLGGPKKPTIDDVKRAADEYNRIGERAAAAGITQGLHNEDFEMFHGRRQAHLRPSLRTPRSPLREVPVPGLQHPVTASTPPNTLRSIPAASSPCTCKAGPSTDPKIAPVGQDSLNWQRIFTAAKTGGIQNYFVEMELPMMQASVPYLKQLHV